MTEKVTPKILDKNRREGENAPDDSNLTDGPRQFEPTAVPEETETEKEDVPMIVHRQTYIDNEGVFREKLHGPMPVSEWAAYEKKNNL